MTRETTLEAFRYLVESEILPERRRDVYSALWRLNHINGPATASETFEEMARIKGHGRYDSNTHARFTELRDMGLAEEVGTRRCRITGRNVIAWHVTNRVEPLPLPKRATKAAQYRALLEQVAAFLEHKIPAAANQIRKRIKEIEG